MNINYENIKAAYYRGQNILKIYSGSTMEWEYETEPMEQTTKQIWYNSVSGDVVEPYAASAMGTLVSNTAYEAKCVLEFASDVTAIGANAFSGCTDLEYVSVPVSATSIGDNAFDGCSALDGIYMPSVQRIGRESFKDCAFSSFTISTAVTAITADAFKGVAMESFNYLGTKAQWSGITTGDFWDDDTWLTNVVHCTDGDIELYQYDYSKRYFELVATSGGTFNFSGSTTANTISYSTDQGKTWSTPAQVVSVNVNSGDSVMWKGEMIQQQAPEGFGIGIFSGSTASFDAQGNTLSLFYGDNYKEEQTDIYQKSCAFIKLFAGSKIQKAGNLILLPQKYLGYLSYKNMFSGCTSLTQAPVLSATQMRDGCYYQMFIGCSSLVQAPALPSINLWTDCYINMFKGCTSLTQAPTLPATSIPQNAYFGMFENCTSLVQAPALPATTLQSRYNYAYMFKGCRSLTQAPALPATSVTFSAYTQMFSGCTALTTAPSLPATTLDSGCYADMFNGCSRLTTAPSLPATTLANDCYRSMFSGCTSLTTAPSLPATTLANACYQRMFSKCTSLTAAPQLPSTGLTSNCYANMFQGCTALTAATELPSIALANSCYLNMYNGCTSLTTAPDLSATTLVSGCYTGMFYGCSSLNYIKMLATDISADACLSGWVGNVANIGTFVKAASMTSLPTGSDGIPSGWTVQDDTPPAPIDYSQEYFTIVAKEDGEIYVTPEYIEVYHPGEEDPEDGYIEYVRCAFDYSVNNGTWQTEYALDETIAIEVSTGDEIRFKCNLADMVFISSSDGTPQAYQKPFSLNGSQDASFDVQGNIMSLVYGDNFQNNTGLTYEYTYVQDEGEGPVETSATCDVNLYGMFMEAYVVDASNLILPSTELTYGCYQSMFFQCSSLTTAPELPALTLVAQGYDNMFAYCSNLNYIKMLATDISASNCLTNWVIRVADSGTFVKNASMASLPTGNNGIPNGWSVEDFTPPTPEHDYANDYFTIVAKEDGTINVYGCDYFDQGEEAMGWCEIEYSTDNGETWDIAPYEPDDGPSIIYFDVQSGDTIMLKYDARDLYDNPDIELNNPTPCLFNNGDGSAQFEVQGNIMSLIYGDDFTGNTSLDYNGREITFGYMFAYNEMLINAENLVLPTTTLNKCYDGMFSDCTNLITAPKLPATTLVGACYYGMFRGCTSLTTAPELPATILTTEMNEGCYQELFQGCSSLNHIKMLATNISATNCLKDWVDGVAASGTFVKDVSMTTLPTGNNGIPTGWTTQNA